MLLNSKQIKDKGLICNDKTDNYKSASYTLQVGKIIDEKDNTLNSHFIPPRGLVTVVSKETLNIPDGVLCYTTLKNELSLRGLLAINVGIVDPGWNAPISSAVMNFGKNNYKIEEGSKFLRVTFHSFDKDENNPPKEEKYTFEKYVNERKNNHELVFSKNFLLLDKLLVEVFSENKYIIFTVLGVIIALFSLMLAMLKLLLLL